MHVSLTSIRFRWVPRAAGLFLGVWAIICATLAILHPVRHMTHPIWTALDDYVLFLSPNLAWASFLGLLAAAVAARKRPAWWILVGLMALNFTSSQVFVGRVDPLSIVSTALAGCSILVTVLARGQFTTAVRPASFRKALIVLAIGLAASVALGTLLVEAVHGSLPASQGFSWTLNKVFGGLVENGVFDGHPPEQVNDLLGLLGALSLLGAFATMFQSQTLRAELGPREEQAVRAMLDLHGGQDSLGYFGTRRDKAVVFAPNGRAAVLYRVEIGVCLASGDPIGDRDMWPLAIDAWKKIADAYAWSPAVMGASEAGARAYEAAGLNAIQLGDEAIIDTQKFTLNGPDMHVVRQAVRRVERLGLTARIRRHGVVPAADMQRAIASAAAWRGGETERGFSMALGRLADPADAACVLVEALDPDGELMALLSFVPWGPTGLSLDLMRRNPEAPNGVIEFMVADLARRGPELGIHRISLNFAVFRAAFEDGDRIGAGPILRGWRRLLILLSRWWQLEALYRSNVKFLPTWNPRYVCYDDARMLVRVGIASGMAEGFVNVPSWLRSSRGIAPTALTDAELDHITEQLRDERASALAEPRPPEQVRVRRDKLERLEARGGSGYPAAACSPEHVRDVVASQHGSTATISGRVVRLRDHGEIAFADLRDWSGTMQVVFQVDGIGPTQFSEFQRSCDAGDLIDVHGTVDVTNTGQTSLFASSWRMSAKCLHPVRGQSSASNNLPPHLDLALHDEARTSLMTRSNVVRALRTCLDAEGFTEVETPVLQHVHGGANARPFATHLNAFDADLTLRIAPELYLKRLCVGGMEKVFEIGRVFRNEGVDRTHHPEFTSLELYEAHVGYDRMRERCRAVILAAAVAAHGAEIAVHPEHGKWNLSEAWPVVTVHEAVSTAVGETVDVHTPVDVLTRLCTTHGLTHLDGWDAGRLVLQLYEGLVEPRTIGPTFYSDFPTSVCPLTRSKDEEPGIAERWDLVAFGMEIATAYSELTDPIEQRRRMRAQSLHAAQGDVEAMELDEDFLEALEYGMPPTGGLGLGVERLVMMLTGRTIRDVVTFPLNRAHHDGAR